jgi:hypothetical protein
MTVSSALAWLCEEPNHSFTLNMVYRRGWPGLADLFLLPKQLTLGRAARTLERVLFLGGLAVALVGYWPELTIWLVVGLKVGAVLVGLVTQGTLKAAEYLTRGAERVLPLRAGQGKPIDLERYAGRKTK